MIERSSANRTCRNGKADSQSNSRRSRTPPQTPPYFASQNSAFLCDSSSLGRRPTKMKDDHQDHKESQMDDRIIKWVKDHDGVFPATDSAGSCHKFGSENGLVSDLHDECLQVMKELKTAWQNSKDNIYLRARERVGIGDCYGKLNLWGDTLQGGKLEASLEVAPTLRQTILGAFVRIGHALLFASRKHYQASQTTDSEHCQVPTSNLKVLIEKASHVLTAEDSDLSTLQRHDATDEEDSDAESVSGGDEDDSPWPPAESWATTLLRVLSFRTRLLMDLLPTIQQILTTSERGYRPYKTQPPSKFHASEAARHWIRQILDRFQDADGPLAERLGEANSQRYDELRREKDPSDSTFIITEGAARPKSFFRPAITIYDSGLGTSIITPGAIPASAASHSSFLPSLADGTSRRVPKTPNAVALGIPFNCEICGHRLTTIKDRTQWKAHVFADIKPYVCTFTGCRDQLTVFPTRKLWTEHEFHKHRCYSFFKCYICSQHLKTEEMLFDHLRNKHSLAESRPQQLGAIIQRAKNVQARPIEGEQCPLCRRADWSTQRAFVKHLGKHFEDIALLALPLGDDSEEEIETDEPHKVSGASPAGDRDPTKAVPLSMASTSLKEPSVQQDSSRSEGHSQGHDPDQPSQSHTSSGLEQVYSRSIPRPLDRAPNSCSAKWHEVLGESSTITTNVGHTAPPGHRFYCFLSNCEKSFIRRGDYKNHVDQYHHGFEADDPMKALRKIPPYNHEEWKVQEGDGTTALQQDSQPNNTPWELQVNCLIVSEEIQEIRKNLWSKSLDDCRQILKRAEALNDLLHAAEVLFLREAVSQGNLWEIEVKKTMATVDGNPGQVRSLLSEVRAKAFPVNRSLMDQFLDFAKYPSQTEWDQHKSVLVHLHENERRPLTEIVKIMEDKHGFVASSSQYQSTFGQWCFREGGIRTTQFIPYEPRKEKYNVIRPIAGVVACAPARGAVGKVSIV
ncbi:uncharacterized protein PV07_11677 [Cladophialophora immunda]|uniref:C2H2-type domain-containing protein n=1 Tax=Cladophialophora immunda TaxID=569365 RepID=A0A0D2BWQ2_9EURO|nr:uncharacterized protein PV07_11677 [Cladophialophora immunda]KIW23483.1 hypothetical protein PV07_11677 [Cladophialophora immunda]